MIAFLITIADTVVGFVTNKVLGRFFDSKKKSESTTEINALMKMHEESLKNAVKAKGLELELAHEKKDKERIQADLDTLKNRLADLPKSLAKAQETIIELEAILEQRNNKIADKKLKAALSAFKKSDLSKAEKILIEVEENERLSKNDFGYIAYARGSVAKQDVRWKDAAEHYLRAAQLAPCFKTLIMAQRLTSDMGDYDSSLSFAEDARKAAIAEYGEGSEEHANSLNNLAVIYLIQEQYKEAEPLYKQTLDIKKNIFGDKHKSTANTLSNLAGLYQKQERYKEAEPLLKESIIIKKELLGESHPDTAISINNLAEIYVEQGMHQKAEPLLNEALKIRQKSLRKNHPSIANSLNSLAVFYHIQKRYKEADNFYLQAMEIVETILGPKHPHTKLVKKNYEINKRYLP